MQLETYTNDVLDRLVKGKNIRRVAVALSGGADSKALALLAATWAKKRKIPLTCLTVNHNLRKDAAKEAQSVARWCETQKINHEILSYEGEKPTANIMEQARSIRYQLLFGWCEKEEAALLVAHNLEDQVETFLMRLQRGTGVLGLSGMPEQALRYGIHVLRPLLAVPRSALEKHLKNKKQKWINDPTNADPKYDRNQLRMALASNPRTAKELNSRLFETARSAGRTRQLLEKEMNKAILSCVKEVVPTVCALDVAKYRMLEEEIALRLLSQLLEYTGHTDKKVRFESLLPLHEKIVSQKAFKPTTLAGCLMARQENTLFFCLEAKHLPAALSLKKNAPTVWGSFTFAAEEAGIKVKALGASGAKLAGKEAKNLPKPVLATLPSLWKKEEGTIEKLLFSPHMGNMPPNLGVKMRYNPRKKLEITPFAYCRAPVFAIL